MRIAENGTCYRYEKSGEVNGLLRVRGVTIDDTHTFVRHNQIANEIDGVLDLVKAIFETFGFKEYRAQVSIRDPKTPEKYLGDEKNWKEAENSLVSASKKHKINYKVVEGEAAFYGPKIDFMVKDSLNREWQLATCQLDYNQPENFDMNYINEDGEKERPAVLHIAILGSVERFLGILIEHYAGSFPVWLAPIQVKVLPITDKNLKYSQTVVSRLSADGIRCELDERSETLQAKIRDAQIQKIPYMLIIGNKEEKEKTVSERSRSGKNYGSQSLEKFIQDIKKEIETKSLD